MADDTDRNEPAPAGPEALKQFVRAAVREALKEAQGTGAPPSPPPPSPPSAASEKSIWVVIIGQITNPTIIISAVALAATAALGFGLYQSGGRFLESLQHTEIARGLITFLIAMATVSIAIIVSLYAVLSADSTLVKERFPLAKEVLTLLIGILGTILGFYFGSADKAGATLDIGDIQVAQGQLYTRVSGGMRPYRYSMTSSDSDFPAVPHGVSEDGWIIQPLAALPKLSSTITIEVTDGKDLRVTKKKSITLESLPKPAPTAPEPTVK
jgi:hypothetical protein